MQESKNVLFIRSRVIDYFKVDTILLDGMGVKKIQVLYHKDNGKTKFYTVILVKFNVILVSQLVFVIYCDAKYSDILRGPSHNSCHLFFT